MVTYHTYNLSAFQSSSSGGQSMLNFLQATSAQVDFMPGAMILVSLFLILFLALRAKGNTPKVCLAASSFACTMVALIMYPLQILHPAVYMFFIAITPFSVLVLFLTAPDY